MTFFQRLGQRKPLVVGLGFVVLVAIAVVALVMPKTSAVKDQQKLLDKAQQQGSQLEAQVATLQQAKRDAPHVRKQLGRLELQIPGVAKLPHVIRQIKSIADDAAVDFVQIQPGAPTVATAGSYSTIPTQVGATGSYFAVTEFLYRLETLHRAVKVTGVTLGPGPDGLPQLQLQLNTELYTTDTSAGPGSAPGHTAGSSTSSTTVPSTTTSGTTSGSTGGA